jgi:hypothetical protein
MTAALDGHEHEVTAEEIALGRAEGTYIAVCGCKVRRRPADEPPGPGCLVCTAAVLADNHPAPGAVDGRARTHWRQHPHWMARRCRSVRHLAGRQTDRT